MRLATSSQLRAARALAGLSQKDLASLAGLHVNSIRYLERQNYLTTDYSKERVEEALERSGVEVFISPSIGVRLSPGNNLNRE